MLISKLWAIRQINRRTDSSKSKFSIQLQEGRIEMRQVHLKTAGHCFRGRFENQRWRLMKVAENLLISEAEIQPVKIF
jgi:hypothetical protein